MKLFQFFNKKTKAWVKYMKMPSGKTRILNVKQKNPSTKFVGVPVKRR